MLYFFGVFYNGNSVYIENCVLHKILSMMVYVSLEVTKTVNASSFKDIKDIYRSFMNVSSLYFLG